MTIHVVAKAGDIAETVQLKNFLLQLESEQRFYPFLLFFWTKIRLSFLREVWMRLSREGCCSSEVGVVQSVCQV